MNIIKIALVGIGGFSRYHYDRIKEVESLGGLKLTAVMIRAASLERYRGISETLKADGIRIYTSYEAMLMGEQGNVDLFIIPTGISDHCEMSIAALEAGYHVLCEKPVAGTLEECIRMKVAQEQSGKLLAICFQHIYSPAIQRMKEIALSGRLGGLKLAKTSVLWQRADAYYARSPWSGKLSFQGATINDCPLMNATAHFLNNMLYMAGKTHHEAAQPVVIYGENYRVKKIDSCDTQFLRVVTDTGARLLFMTTHSTDVGMDPRSEYVFEHGKITWSFDGVVVVYEKIGDDYVEVERFGNGGVEPIKAVYTNVGEAIRSGSQPLAVIRNSYQHVMCVEKSLESGAIVDLPVEYVGATNVLHDYDCMKTGDVNLYIKGIKPLMDRMFVEELSFYEAGCPWAIQSREVRINGNQTGSHSFGHVEKAVSV